MSGLSATWSAMPPAVRGGAGSSLSSSSTSARHPGSTAPIDPGLTGWRTPPAKPLLRRQRRADG
ncbi:hypothetical protein [Saccharopolyspora spinosa]|uniref:Uncharacterized protein n=1 Tax=Saccharopolyspora spinosa TaxID=60894 RepID=A0A2N3Y2C0_SACSN|nr:hypothetical protein [Saccharopolyspora spinosa]PKW17045.1 hypothetical protein A8926_4967 [Saccharopolyspora spinosa]